MSGNDVADAGGVLRVGDVGYQTPTVTRLPGRFEDAVTLVLQASTSRLQPAAHRENGRLVHDVVLGVTLLDSFDGEVWNEVPTSTGMFRHDVFPESAPLDQDLDALSASRALRYVVPLAPLLAVRTIVVWFVRPFAAPGRESDAGVAKDVELQFLARRMAP